MKFRNKGIVKLQVEILSEGDNVNELMLLVGGMVEVLRPGAEDAEELTIDVDGHSSIRGGSYNRSEPLLIPVMADVGLLHTSACGTVKNVLVFLFLWQ